MKPKERLEDQSTLAELPLFVPEMGVEERLAIHIKLINILCKMP